ncbi:M61 family metallopeptidase [Chitinibacter fontanus]|uniref:M61 family metallopeptidase n=1 Tax=Chitinibacter fontanus TaxID=1737446 RepID=A0A7D5ZG97_9NEIS|nr:PDZ domain-containing protein [Chitinibacter fontanus]QLI83066.1 M61 family metallopeptidase [Chitinibacter fontanus]
MTISYRIAPLDVAAHLFVVELLISHPNPAGQQLQLPTWIPGSYLIREFARNIVQISATSAGQAVAIHKLDKSSWQLAPCEQALTVRYEVYAFDLSVRGAYLDQTRAFFNGTSVFLAVAGQESTPCQVTIAAQDFINYKHWQVATGLPAQELDPSGFGHYCAANYDELIDCPVEISDFASVEFEACGVPHRMVISGRHKADLTRLAQDLKPICEYQIRLFGEPAPFNNYLFMTVAVGDGYGGLEHRNSTALICNRDDLPSAGNSELSKGYRQFLGLCSHEYFHSWNVKRIKPAAYAPYQLQQENYTSLLWAFEGITSYYDDLTLLRAGLIDTEAYLELLAQTATAAQRGYGRLRQTLNDSSIDTWVKYYRQDENSPNELVSYYTKGALVALCLDLHIRQQTQNAKSLDDVMRALWLRFGKPFNTQQLGIGETEWEAIASEVTGLNLSAFFDLAIRSTGELPLSNLLATLGIETQLRIASSNNDKGGWLNTVPNPSASWGIRYNSDPAGIKISHVLRGQAACLAGLSAGDLIIAIDGLRASTSLLERLQQQPANSTVHHIHAFRRDELMTFAIEPQAAIADTFGFRISDSITNEKRKLLDSFAS